MKTGIQNFIHAVIKFFFYFLDKIFFKLEYFKYINDNFDKSKNERAEIGSESDLINLTGTQIRNSCFKLEKVSSHCNCGLIVRIGLRLVK